MIILREVDQGERDPDRLAETAFREWTGTERSPDSRPLGSGVTFEYEALEKNEDAAA